MVMGPLSLWPKGGINILENEPGINGDVCLAGERLLGLYCWRAAALSCQPGAPQRGAATYGKLTR